VSKEWSEVKTQTLTTDEIERLLRNDFGDKIQPVDSAKLAKHRKEQARYKNNKES
jgi:hypothetical protein